MSKSNRCFLILLVAIFSASTTEEVKAQGSNAAPSTQTGIVPSLPEERVMVPLQALPYLRVEGKVQEAWLKLLLPDNKPSGYSFMARRVTTDNVVDLVSIRTPKFIVVFVRYGGKTQVMLKPPLAPGQPGVLMPVKDERIVRALEIGARYMRELLKSRATMVLRPDPLNPVLNDIRNLIIEITETCPENWPMTSNDTRLIGSTRSGLYFFDKSL